MTDVRGEEVDDYKGKGSVGRNQDLTPEIRLTSKFFS